MAYDEGLAERIREILNEKMHCTEKKMFGGLCFLLNGNMCCGIVGEELMVRVGPDAYAKCLKQKYAREMDFTGRPMKGMLFIATKGIEADQDLQKWVNHCLNFVAGLPEK
ncbi:MAG: TfoX/Sxy family protein [Gammaproteobacteria bacterium]|nr:TfoX/Sxy family protein [Gammaproteobacteria bacterium]MDH5731887.1 TfoX/Sxy family protein [Gammaproteobacteria bacterium]